MNENTLPQPAHRPHTRQTGPVEMSPAAELTNDPAKMEERSRPAPDWEIQEASEQGFQGGR